MADLRTALTEALENLRADIKPSVFGTYGPGRIVFLRGKADGIEHVLDLIPEGSVLVTEETRDHAKYLAQAASHLADHLKEQYPTFYCEDLDNVRHFAAAILARISDD